ncbi:MAG TPA: sigma-70 family RNA polymerase sigma factor [Ktedonobacteraceae bacterium]|nr:sigma-70 family RNA polymerase sigma factor [Ktedonobacteraceae bacterium]HXZ03594.1 sigma-70 family RNA polymerase sigma factor [Ktedonobacteraceae bacterium]
MTEPEREDELLLINLSQKGDVNAFNQLVVKYQQATFNVVLRMLGDRNAAADVTQDTFIAAFRAIQSFRGGPSFRAWLFRIASNQACDYWRRDNRHPQDSLDAILDDDEPHDSGLLNALVTRDQAANPEEFLLNHELQELLQKGIQELPLDQRVAVILCDVQGLTYEEIATSTQTNLGTVRSRIARGRKRLRDYLYKHRELLPGSYRLLTDRE